MSIPWESYVFVGTEVWNPEEKICLNKLIGILEKMRNEYGGNALIYLDAGWTENGIQATVIKNV